MTAPFVPPADDSSVQMLRAVFGSVIDHIAGAATSAAQSPQAAMLTAAFEFFNSGILFFGSVLLTWITLTGTVHTANDGTALGKNWNTMWTPVRTITATASLMPIASGYAVIQAFILTVVLWSVGLASGMWSKVVDVGINENIADQASINVMNEASFQDATTAALQMRVCAMAVNQAVNAAITDPAGGTGAAINLQPVVREADIGNAHTITFQYEDPNWPRSTGLCGALTLKVDKPVPEQNFFSTTKYMFHADASATSRQVKAELASQVQSITSAYYTRLFTDDGEIAELAEKIVNVKDNPTVSAQELVNAIGVGSTMWTQINEAAASIARANNQNLTESLTAGGWIYAGSWQTEVGRVQDTLRSTLVNAKVETTAASHDLSSSLSGDLLAATQPIVEQARVTTAELVKKAIEIIRVQGGVAAAAGKKTDLSCQIPGSPISPSGVDPSDAIADGGQNLKHSVSTYFNESIGDHLITCIIANVANQDQDPVLQLKGLGDSLMTYGELLLATVWAVDGGIDGLRAGLNDFSSNILGQVAGAVSLGGKSVAVGIINGILSFLQSLIEFSAKFITMILYCGYFLGIWLPMVPFLIFALGVVGWLITVVISVAASSLWMVMHITPEGGDSFVGGQKQGYLLVMSLFFRPALMVLGIAASMAILYPSMGFINAAFEIKMRSLQVQSVTGLGSILGYLMVYCFLVLAVMTIVFALPQTFPDHLMRWIGAGVPDLGEQHSMSRVEAGASGQAKAAVMGALGSKLKEDREAGKARISKSGEKGGDNKVE